MTPYKSAQTIPLKPSQDARRRLTLAQREEIRLNRLGLSAGALAKEYGVSRRLVQIILDPAKYDAMKEAQKKRAERAGGWTAYQSPYDHTTAVRKLRRKKYDLYKKCERGEVSVEIAPRDQK